MSSLDTKREYELVKKSNYSLTKNVSSTFISFLFYFLFLSKYTYVYT